MAGGGLEIRWRARDAARRAEARSAVIPYPFRFLLLGTPGAGKGTQARLMRQRFGMWALSEEYLFRNAVHAGGGAPESAFASRVCDGSPEDGWAAGAVADRLSPEVIDRFRCPEGFTLKGFPRTVAEAEALDDLFAKERLDLTAVLNFEISPRTAELRLTGRRLCGECGAVYHRTRRPERVEGVCDRCGGPVCRREEDRREAVRQRIEAYGRDAAPLIDYYSRRVLLVTVEAAGSPEEVFQRTEFKLLNALPAIA